MSRYKTTLVVSLACVALAGCASRGFFDSEVASRPALSPFSSPAVSLLYYFDYLRTLPPAELARETEHARRLHASEKSDFRLLQYVATLAVPGGDTNRALQLLEPMIRDGVGHARELRGLAVLLHTELSERRRLEASVQNQTRRTEELESKLEALKNIEMQMMQREPSGKPGGKRR